MTWSALVDTKQELDGMKDLQQNVLKSLADCKAEIRNLCQEVENLKIVNTVQNKRIKEMERKNAKETATKLLGRASYEIAADHESVKITKIPPRHHSDPCRRQICRESAEARATQSSAGSVALVEKYLTSN